MLQLEEDSQKERRKLVNDILNGLDDGWISLFNSILAKISRSDISADVWSRGLSIALSTSLQFFDTLKSRMNWSDGNLMLNLVQQVMLRQLDLQHLMFDKNAMMTCSQCLLMTFLAQAQANVLQTNSDHALYILTIQGVETDALLFKNQLIMNIPVPPLLSNTSNCDLTVALFNCSLEFPHVESSLTFYGSTLDNAVTSPEYQYLEQFVSILILNDVNAVICQKRVHPYLQRLLTKHKIVCLPRVSIRFMAALVRLSGGRQLGNMPLIDVNVGNTMDKSCFGRLKSLRKQYIFGKPFVVAIGDHLSAAQSFSTLLLCGHSSALTTALESATHDVLRHLTKLLREPYILPYNWRCEVCQSLVTYVESNRISVSRCCTRDQILNTIDLLCQELRDNDSRSSQTHSINTLGEVVNSWKSVVNALLSVLDIDDEICVRNEAFM